MACPTTISDLGGGCNEYDNWPEIRFVFFFLETAASEGTVVSARAFTFFKPPGFSSDHRRCERVVGYIEPGIVRHGDERGRSSGRILWRARAEKENVPLRRGDPLIDVMCVISMFSVRARGNLVLMMDEK